MTSPMNEAPTRAFFEENKFFGLNPERVTFFSQAMWPALDPNGKILLDAPGRIFMSPDGHGGTLSALDRSGCLADMRRRNLTTVFYLQVDNPLVDIADPGFIGNHLRNGADISLKVCTKRDPDEGLGVVVDRGGKTLIVEYSELTPEQKRETRPDGRLRFLYGSVAIHVFSVAFLAREAAAGLPLHIAHKKVPVCDAEGRTGTPSKPNAYKFEKFIFDALADARVCACVAFDRAEEFSPVKNADGADSPATCRRDLSAKWARWLRSGGVPVALDAQGYAKHKVEIDPCYALDAQALHERLAAERPALDPHGDILLTAQ
jgi:UDP-N-acetylglucosamine/UDP-N-acetylgalactosamine diphosphorylase